MTIEIGQSRKELVSEYLERQKKPLSLDISIGKLSKEQLELSQGLMSDLGEFYISPEEGIDVRNYDENRSEGIIEARRLMGSIISYPAEEVIVHGNSCLSLMHSYIQHKCGDQIKQMHSKGITPKMLIPVPGFYRHFMLCESLGIQPIPLEIHRCESVIDSDELEIYSSTPWNMHGPLVDGVLGIICVPRHSNPTGHIYPDYIVSLIASLPLDNPGFQVLWDNAYAKHDFYKQEPESFTIRQEAYLSATEDSNAVFTSTSKITYAGAGIAAVGLSPKNFKSFTSYLNQITIGPDKYSQLQHVRFFDEHPFDEHMAKHADIMRPKFELLSDYLERNLEGFSGVSWTRPKGGFFISIYTIPGTAKRVIELCAKLGLKLTAAGACFPGKKDLLDSHIRVAPAAVMEEDLEAVAQTISLSIRLAALEDRQGT